MSRFTEYPLDRRFNPDSTHTTIYHVDSRKCACKGSGLVPPPAERVGKEPQAYCPKHPCVRYWPQQQKDGSIAFKECASYGLK